MKDNLFARLTRLGWLPKFDVLRPLEEYDLQDRPQRNIRVKGSQAPITGEVHNGKAAVTTKTETGTETTYIMGAPRVASEVVLDAFDMAFLDSEVGIKWRSEDSIAKVMKWHWLQERSAKDVEKYHRAKDGQLEKGFSTRNAAKFIKSFYAADNERESQGKERQRKPVTGASNAFEVEGFTPPPPTSNHVEW